MSNVPISMNYCPRVRPRRITVFPRIIAPGAYFFFFFFSFFVVVVVKGGVGGKLNRGGRLFEGGRLINAWFELEVRMFRSFEVSKCSRL